MAVNEKEVLFVTVREAFKPGEFIVSEPIKSETQSSHNRLQLEENLSSTILKQLCSENGNNEINEDDIAIQELVAVNAYSLRTWFRGQIRGKMYYKSKTVWSVLLVDRGELIQVERKDVLILPERFRHQPFYARYAVLGDVEPLAKKLDVSTLKLRNVAVEFFDAGAQNFIRDLINCCNVFKMTVFGQDQQQRLHIRLFFKGRNSEDPYICLNSVLCEESYAKSKEPSVELKPVILQSSTCFWETLTDTSAELTRNDKIKIHAIGIADYAQALEKEKIKKLQELSNKSEFNSPLKSSSLSPASSFNSPSNLVRGRGSAIGSSYFNSRDISPGLMPSEASNSLNDLELFAHQVKSTLPPTADPCRSTNSVFIGRGYHRSPKSHHVQPGLRNSPGDGPWLTTHMPGCIPAGMRLGNLTSRRSTHRNEYPNLRNTATKSNEDTSLPIQPATPFLRPTMITPERTSPASTDSCSDNIDIDERLTESSMRTRDKKSSASPDPYNHKKDDDEELSDLLKLALDDPSEPKNVSTRKKSEPAKPQLKGLSRLKEHMEHGRVLVRSPFQHVPRHNLNEIPFHTIIKEALLSLDITKPKMIQSYVWHDILSGFSVAFIAGARCGKTLGYLVPILNTLLDANAYTGLPKGCSPKAIVVCSTWESAEMVHSYCTRIMKRVPEFRTASLTDSSASVIKDAIAQLTNGVTLLATTAPALAVIMEQAINHINFDRCCHLVYEDADALIQEHPDVMKKILVMYRKSVKRTESCTDAKIFVPRQVIACGSHWTPGMETITTKAMTAPLIFIASHMEAAIYCKMKLIVQHGTPQEMDTYLVQIVQQKRQTKTIIFCRSPAEVMKVNNMINWMDAKICLVHDQSIATNFDRIEQMWIESPAMILICTDDVLIRLNIRDADTLIHYYVPHQSQYDFSYRLSFCLDKFKCPSEENLTKPESHVLITKEFSNSLLTIVRFMQRFGLEVPDKLVTEAILSYCGREMKKKDIPLCFTLKALGFCRKPKLCGMRHIILNELDQPLVPRNGLVDLRISAVHSTTNYYARILRHRGEDNRITDMTAQHLIVEESIKDYFSAGALPVANRLVEVGSLYATPTIGGFYERVRIECVLDVDYEGKTIQVSAMSIDRGALLSLNINDIYELPDHLKQLPPLAVEIFLAGIKPLDNKITWSRSSIRFIQTQLKDKVVSGHIVLGLSSTLWVDRLVERTKLDGDRKVMVNLLDVGKKILDEKLGLVNKEHMAKLYHLCQTGSIELPDYSVGLVKTSLNKVTANYAFLPVDTGTVTVGVQAIESPQRFYVVINEWQTILADLERDIEAGLGMLKLFKADSPLVGRLCVAKSVDDVWCRGCIKDTVLTDGKLGYKIFFVDYGDYGTAPLEDLRVLSQTYIDRLPFQAIACTLQGLEPADPSGWSREEIDFFVSLTRDGDYVLNNIEVKPKMKETQEDEVTMGPRYCVELACELFEPTNLLDIFMKWRSGDKTVTQSASNSSPSNKLDEDGSVEDSESGAVGSNLEGDKDDVLESWIGFLTESKNSSSDDLTPSTAVDSKRITCESDCSVPLQIVEGIYPTKSASSVFPSTKWCQNEDVVRITFVVDGVLSESDYELQLTDNHLKFATTAGGKRYELDTNLYSGIIPQQSASAIVRLGVKVVLKKKTGADWPRLTNSPFKLPWLSRDFDGWSHEWGVDSYESDNQFTDNIVPDPEYVFGDRQPETSSSSDSDSSDEWENDDWD